MAAHARLQLGLDYFDPMSAGNDRTALWIVENRAGSVVACRSRPLAARSNQVANWLRRTTSALRLLGACHSSATMPANGK
jgi:hypothetical protein